MNTLEEINREIIKHQTNRASDVMLLFLQSIRLYNSIQESTLQPPPTVGRKDELGGDGWSEGCATIDFTQKVAHYIKRLNIGNRVILL